MKKYRIPLQVVFYKDDGRWYAHCLQFDVIGDGESRDEAAKCLSEAILIQLEASARYNNVQNLFAPADGKYFEMFASGEEIAVGEMKLAMTRHEMTHAEVSIEGIESREYTERELIPT